MDFSAAFDAPVTVTAEGQIVGQFGPSDVLVRHIRVLGREHKDVRGIRPNGAAGTTPRCRTLPASCKLNGAMERPTRLGKRRRRAFSSPSSCPTITRGSARPWAISAQSSLTGVTVREHECQKQGMLSRPFARLPSERRRSPTCQTIRTAIQTSAKAEVCRVVVS